MLMRVFAAGALIGVLSSIFVYLDLDKSGHHFLVLEWFLPNKKFNLSAMMSDRILTIRCEG